MKSKSNQSLPTQSSELLMKREKEILEIEANLRDPEMTSKLTPELIEMGWKIVEDYHRLKED